MYSITSFSLKQKSPVHLHMIRSACPWKALCLVQTPTENKFPPLSALVCVCVCTLSRFSHVRLFATLWTVGCQDSLSMGFSRQEHWSGLPFPSPWDLLDPENEPVSVSSIGRQFLKHQCHLGSFQCPHLLLKAT